jgi:hypothetical protein
MILKWSNYCNHILVEKHWGVRLVVPDILSYYNKRKHLQACVRQSVFSNMGKGGKCLHNANQNVQDLQKYIHESLQEIE